MLVLSRRIGETIVIGDFFQKRVTMNTRKYSI